MGRTRDCIKKEEAQKQYVEKDCALMEVAYCFSLFCVIQVF